MQVDKLILATRSGLKTAQRSSNGWLPESEALVGEHITCLATSNGTLLAGTRDGLWRSEDGGEHWETSQDGLSIRLMRWLAAHPDEPGLFFAGAEPAGIFVSEDDGRSWSLRLEVGTLRDEHGWMLPYSPEAGCVRGFALHTERQYAAVEVGGALVSTDNGSTWALAKGSNGRPVFGTPPAGLIHPDVHDIFVHPSDANLVLAPTGGGLYRSTDGGDSWEILYSCYTRALWWDPEDPQHITFGPAQGVGRGGRIEESRDGGLSWQDAYGDLPAPWRDTMPERFVPVADSLFCILDDGRLLYATIGTHNWQELDAFTGVNALVAI